MAKLSGKEIQKLARSIVAENPGGIRYSVLVDTISQQNPETPKNTVHGSVWNLDTIFPNEITKPSRGLFTPITKSGSETGVPESTEQIAPTGIKIRESAYKSGSVAGDGSAVSTTASSVSQTHAYGEAI